MRCSKCAAENRERRKFCAECGVPLNARCASCGAENQPTEKFCGDCGVALTGQVQAVSAKAPTIKPTSPNIRVTPEQPDASAVIDGERKTVTALFADIKGSTELMEELDPEEARAIIDPVLQLMIEAVHRYERLRRAIDRRRHLRAVRRARRARGPSAARTACGAGDAGGAASLRRPSARGGQAFPSKPASG